MRHCHSLESLLIDLLARNDFLRDLLQPLYRFNLRIFAHRQIGEKISTSNWTSTGICMSKFQFIEGIRVIFRYVNLLHYCMCLCWRLVWSLKLAQFLQKIMNSIFWCYAQLSACCLLETDRISERAELYLGAANYQYQHYKKKQLSRFYLFWNNWALIWLNFFRRFRKLIT